MLSPRHHHRSSCRLCESARVVLAVPIKATPVADAYLPAEKIGSAKDALIPLDLYLCEDCGHVQLLDVVAPEDLFGDYIYSTGDSASLVEHFRRYAEEMMRRLTLAPGGLAVDIGSNDGTLLAFLKERGLRVCGVEPAPAIAAKARARGVPTRGEFLNAALAQSMRDEHGPASLVTANNVFAHVDDLGHAADCVATLLADDGVFVFEVSYLQDIVDGYLFDTVYHEHLCYHSVRPLALFFERHGLELFDVERIPTKGGSLRGYVQKLGATRPVSGACRALSVSEKERGLGDMATFSAYAARIDSRKQEVLALLAGCRARGERIAGYGASATVTTLIYHFELGSWLEFLADDNPARHGLFSPGWRLPVRPSSELSASAVDVVVILAWQYAEPIIRRHRAFLERGGRFLVPLPSPRWITRDNLPPSAP